MAESDRLIEFGDIQLPHHFRRREGIGVTGLIRPNRHLPSRLNSHQLIRTIEGRSTVRRKRELHGQTGRRRRRQLHRPDAIFQRGLAHEGGDRNDLAPLTNGEDPRRLARIVARRHRRHHRVATHIDRRTRLPVIGELDGHVRHTRARHGDQGLTRISLLQTVQRHRDGGGFNGQNAIDINKPVEIGHARAGSQRIGARRRTGHRGRRHHRHRAQLRRRITQNKSIERNPKRGIGTGVGPARSRGRHR